MINSRNLRKQAYARVHGSPNVKSNDELRLHGLIVSNLYDNPGSKYHFHFNCPITEFGVPTKSVRIQDCRDEFMQYIMNRCLIDQREAIELMNMVDAPIRTNTLLLDVGKTRGNKLIAGLESNRGSHYIVPDTMSERISFARSVFADFVKEVEISKIAEFIEVNHWVKNFYGIGSPESIKQELAVKNFASVI